MIDYPIPRDVHDIHDLRHWLAEDINRWVEYCCRYQYFNPGAIQYAMGRFLTSSLDRTHLDCKGLRNLTFKPSNDNRMKKILGMRGISKSFTIQMYLGFRYLRVPHTRTMIISGTEDFASDVGRAILSMLSDLPPLMHLAPTTKVSPSRFDVNGAWSEQHRSIRSYSVMSNMISSRADLFIFDDPETLDNTSDEEQRENIFDRVEQAFNILHPPGRILERLAKMMRCRRPDIPVVEQTQIIVAGTYQHENSIYIEPEEMSDDGVSIRYPWRGCSQLIIPCWDENHESVFPDRLSTEELKFRQTRMSVRNWRLHYELDPTPIDNKYQIIKMDNIVMHEQPEIVQNMMYIDPAESGEDQWGIVIGGIDRKRSNPYVRLMTGLSGDVGGPDAWVFQGASYNEIDDDVVGYVGGHTTRIGQINDADDGILSQIADLIQRFNVTKVVIERNRKVPVALIKRMIRNRGFRCAVDEYFANRNKEQRIAEALDPAINSGTLAFHPTVFDHTKEGRRNHRLLKELRYGFLPKPNDRLDALAGFVVDNIPEVKQLSPFFNRNIGSIKSLIPR